MADLHEYVFVYGRKRETHDETLPRTTVMTTVRLNPPPTTVGRWMTLPAADRPEPLEHTHTVQATKLRRWQYRYMSYGGPAQ